MPRMRGGWEGVGGIARGGPRGGNELELENVFDEDDDHRVGDYGHPEGASWSGDRECALKEDIQKWIATKKQTSIWTSVLKKFTVYIRNALWNINQSINQWTNWKKNRTTNKKDEESINQSIK